MIILAATHCSKQFVSYTICTDTQGRARDWRAQLNVTENHMEFLYSIHALFMGEAEIPTLLFSEESSFLGPISFPPFLREIPIFPKISTF